MSSRNFFQQNLIFYSQWIFLFCCEYKHFYFVTFLFLFLFLMIFIIIFLFLFLFLILFSLFSLLNLFFSHFFIIRIAVKENRYRQLSRIKSIIYWINGTIDWKDVQIRHYLGGLLFLVDCLSWKSYYVLLMHHLLKL